MNYLLDTNICVHFLRGAFDVDSKLRAVGFSNCYISEITLAELEFGIENSPQAFQPKQRVAFHNFSKAFESRTLPIRDCFLLYAKNKSRLRKEGQMISDFDLLIGCTALFHELTMVTENVSEFSRINGITIENWVTRL